MSIEFFRYRQARRVAEDVNNSLGDNHPCSRGNGECCKQRDFAVTSGDGTVIVDAVRSGKIPTTTVNKAIQNANDQSREYCPFFDIDKKECTIYDQRPIVCMIYGTGGLPTQALLQTGAEEFSTKDLRGNRMCQSCTDCLERDNAKFSFNQIFKAANVEMYIRGEVQGERSTNPDAFAQFILPQLARPGSSQ